MVPLAVLAISFCLFFLTGLAGNQYLADYHHALRPALALMFLVTASAHWGTKRVDLLRMVPPVLGKPAIWVTVTGVLEILGAIGLLIPLLAPLAAAGLALLLLALFPANIRAAHLRLTIGGRSVPQLGVRTLLQVIFLLCALLAGRH
jgi:uncharacterized membrane protein